MKRSSAPLYRVRIPLLLLFCGGPLGVLPDAAAQVSGGIPGGVSQNVAPTRRYARAAQRPGTSSLVATPLCSENEAVIELAWTPSSGALSYEIVRNGISIAATGGDIQSFTCAGLDPGSHTFNIRARNEAGSSESLPVSISIPTHFCTAGVPPQTPTLSVNGPFCDSVGIGGVAFGGGVATGIQLTWTAAPNAAAYDLLRDGQPIRTGLKVLALRDHDGLRDGSTYVYVVRATNSKGAANSRTVTVAVPDPFCGGH